MTLPFTLDLRIHIVASGHKHLISLEQSPVVWPLCFSFRAEMAGLILLELSFSGVRPSCIPMLVLRLISLPCASTALASVNTIRAGCHAALRCAYTKACHVIGTEHSRICAQAWHHAIVLDNGDVLSSHVRSDDMREWSHDIQMAPYVRSDDTRKRSRDISTAP
jgi:hypothetical protein